MAHRGSSIWDLWLLPWQAAETLAAANSVIAARSRVIRDALTDPFGADHAELAMMGPEKVAAFGQAGASMFGDMLAMQSAMFHAPHRVAAIAASAPGRALRPIHSRATGNARRLRRASR